MPGPLPVGLSWEGSFPKFRNFDRNKTWHAYVHVPFCEVRCGYCDFNTYTAEEVQGVKRSEFDQSLTEEIRLAAERLKAQEISSKSFQTVFFGGGTPSLFSPGQISRVLAGLRENFGISDDAELTMELNPDTVDEHYLQQVAELGINRVSIGAQSFDPEVLKVLDRTHNPENVELAVGWAKKAGLQVSLDLIYGAPGESLDSWRKSLHQALSMNPHHLSAYALIVEQGTKLARQISKGIYTQPDDDLMADKYALLEEMTSQSGLNWYELSNFSRGEGTKSVHNSGYWKSNYWYGFGPGSHSYIGDVRFWNRKHPAAYSDSLAKGLPIQAYELINEQDHMQERLLLEIRMSDGIDPDLIRKLSISDKALREQIEFGYFKEQDGNFVLTLKGRQMADRVVLNLLN